MAGFTIEFDELDEIVYIADIQTYELLYINQFGIQQLESVSSKDVIGKPCYQVFQELDAPCAFCCFTSLCENAVHEWEYTNSLRNCNYKIIEKLIGYQGHKAVLRVAIRITGIAETQIKNNLCVDEIAMECAKKLQDMDDERQALHETLAMLGRRLHGDRVFIFEIHGKLMSNTYEWCAAGISSRKKDMQSVPTNICRRWLESFIRREPYVIQNVEECKEAEPEIYQKMIQYAVTSRITVPLFEHDTLLGFLGIDNPVKEIGHNIANIMKTLSYYIQKTMMNIKATAKLEEMTYLDGMTSTKNRNAFMLDVEKMNMELHSNDHKKEKKGYGVVFTDVNGLKETNDTAGHDTGDDLLMGVARKIRMEFQDWNVYRTGGDEFVVLCAGIEESDFIKKAAILKQQLSRPSSFESASVGASWSNEALYIEEIINQAEAEMYESKKLYYIDHMQKGYESERYHNMDCYTTILLKNIDVVNAAAELLYLMLENWNTQRMEILLDDAFVLFEEEYQKLYQKKEAMLYLKQQQESNQNQKIRDMQYIRKRIIKGVSICSCYGQLDWKSKNGISYSIPLEMSMLFIQKNGRAKCLYLHSTNIFCRSQYVENVYQVRNDILLNMISRTNIRKETIEQPVNNEERNVAFKVLADAFALLCNEYSNVYFVDVQKDSYVVLKTEGKFQSLVGVAGNYTCVNTDYAQHYMDEETKARYLEFTGRRNLMDNLALGNDFIHMKFMIAKDTSDVGREIEISIWLGILDRDIVSLFTFKNISKCPSKKVMKEKDRLTSLLSYDKFKEDCQILLNQGGQHWAVITVDIQKFKYVNEILGYPEGDNILKSFARHFSSMLVDDAYYTRMSGDLFLAFVRAEDADELIKKIKDTLDQFCMEQKARNDDIRFVLRTGIYFVEMKCKDILIAIDRANLARKSIGQSIHNELCVYGENLIKKNDKSVEIMTRMESALENGDFQVWVQPKVNLLNGSVCGAEALIRWMQNGVVHFYPNDFISVFEDNGFITSLDLYVLETVCRDLRKRKISGNDDVCRISINLSSVDVEKSGITNSILEIVDRFQIKHSLLEFELTETAYFRNTDEAAKVMERLKEEGFTTSVDDFGSGYSVMNMLINIPASVVKIDGNFMWDSMKSERGKAFLKKIIDLIHELGYRALCEGIETREQYECVKHMGCDEGQGYYFARPMPMDEFFMPHREGYLNGVKTIQ